jgi:putative transposase
MTAGNVTDGEVLIGAAASLAEGACHDGENPPPGRVAPAGGRRPLRELVDGRVLDELLERSKDEAGGLRLTGQGSMLAELVAAVLERALAAELGVHLGYGRHERAGAGSGNSRNGYIAKTVQTGVGPVPVQVPRDRNGSFDPVLLPKRAGRISGGLDDMIISLYAQAFPPATSSTTWSRCTARSCRRRRSRGSPGR